MYDTACMYLKPFLNEKGQTQNYTNCFILSVRVHDYAMLNV